MQLYQSRGFSEFFQDTFALLKLIGTHFFKHYLIINGFFLVVMMVLMYFFTQFYTNVLFNGIIGNNPTIIDNYINDNFGLFVIMAMVFFVFALIAGIMSFSYVPLYLKLYAERDGKNFGTSELIAAYKTNAPKIGTFLFCGFLIGIPLILLMGIGAFLLFITIIGIVLLPLLIGAFSLIYNMTLMEYIENKRGIWESFGYAWSLMVSKFWPAVGSVGMFFIMSYIIQGLFSLIPYILGMASLFTTIEDSGNAQEALGTTMTIVMLAVFLLSFLVGSLLSLVVQVNQGVIFYSLKEDHENIQTKSVIDQIGSGT